MRLFEYLLKRFIDYKIKYPLEYAQSFDIMYRLDEKQYVGYFQSEKMSPFSVEVQNLKLNACPCLNIMGCGQKYSFQVCNKGKDGKLIVFSRLWEGSIPLHCIEMFCTLFQYKYTEKHRWLIPEEAIDADSIFEIRLKER